MLVFKKKYSPLEMKESDFALCQDLLVGSVPVENAVGIKSQELNSVNANDATKYNIYWD